MPVYRCQRSTSRAGGPVAPVQLGRSGSSGNASNALRHLRNALSRDLHVMRDLGGDAVLLFKLTGNRRHHLLHGSDRVADASQRLHHLGGDALHTGDLPGDTLGSLGSLCGERLDLAGDHGKAFPRPRRFNRGVETQQGRLRSDLLYELNDGVQRAGALLQALCRRVCQAGVGLNLRHQLSGAREALGDLADRGGHLLRCGSDRLHILQRLRRPFAAARRSSMSWVMSVAYFTILNGVPLGPMIGV